MACRRWTVVARRAVVVAAAVLSLGSCFSEESATPPDEDTGGSEMDSGSGSTSTTASTSATTQGTGNDTSGSTGVDSTAGTGGSTETTAPADSSSSSSGGGCQSETDCDDMIHCTFDSCEGGRCDHSPIDGVDAPPAAQTDGDCLRVVCVDGNDVAIDDDGDLPDDTNVCTDDVCMMGVASHPAMPLGTPCNMDGQCDGLGGCSDCLSPDDCDRLPPDDDCKMRTCTGGMCGQQFADAGTEVNETLQMPGDCQVVVCDGAGATTSQADDGDLPVDGLECTDDVCTAGVPSNPPVTVGTPCGMDGMCDAMGQCVGCMSPGECGGTSTFCQDITCIGNVCGVDNTAAGTPLPAGDQTAGDCQELQCDGSGNVTSVADDGDVPSDDGNDCTGEVCQGGTPQHPDLQVGEPCDDGGGNVCNGSGGCVECIDATDCPAAPQCQDAACIANVCDTTPEPMGTPCNDSLFCTADDACNAGGTCVGTGDPCPGPDGDGDCTESCNEVNNNCSAIDPAGTLCDDGLFCTMTDACNGAGVCAGQANPCPGADGDGDCSETCNEAANDCSGNDAAGTACDDGLFCTMTQTCNGTGSCAGSGNPCPGPDGDGDCSETCDEAANNCNGNDMNGSLCNDGLFCTVTDSCNAGVCGGAGNPCPGADGDSDCSETCNETADACTGNDPQGSACTDGQFCTGMDTCNNAGACVAGTNPCPGADGDSNCAESCNEAGDNCTAQDPNGAACNDGQFCTTTDTCNAGSCSGSGNPCPGPDNDNNCAESCNEGTDNCTAQDPNGSVCNDGLFCTNSSACSAGVCQGTGGNPCPGPDGDNNCAESCNEVSDSCNAQDPNGAVCNDGLFCTASSTCNAGACMGMGNPCSGPDGDANCSESCNEMLDNCTAPDPNGAMCNDGQFCTVMDSCSLGLCQGQGNPCPAGMPDDPNCANSCNEVTNNCTAPDPPGTSCSDGLFCTSGDTCSGSGMCWAGGFSPCPGVDGDDDCKESCDETSDDCGAADPDGSMCDDDGQFCNGQGSCKDATCDMSGALPPCEGPDGDDNCAESCDELADVCCAADPDDSPCIGGQGDGKCVGGCCTTSPVCNGPCI